MKVKKDYYYIWSPWLWIKVVRWPLLAVAEYNSTLVRVIGSWLHVTLLVSNQVVVEGYATVGWELLAAKLCSIDHILPCFTWEPGKVSIQWPGNLLNITPELTCSLLTRGSYHMMLWTKLYRFFSEPHSSHILAVACVILKSTLHEHCKSVILHCVTHKYLSMHCLLEVQRAHTCLQQVFFWRAKEWTHLLSFATSDNTMIILSGTWLSEILDSLLVVSDARSLTGHRGTCTYFSYSPCNYSVKWSSS